MIHVENSGQIRLTQELGQWISKYAEDERFTKYVEIGTWNGRGSTCCFYDGFVKRTSPYALQSYEIFPPRVEEATSLWKGVPDIHIIRGRILKDEDCPVFYEVRKVFPNVNESWHSEDIRNFWSCQYVPLDSPEVVLLDGAEYLTYFEFQKLKHMDSIQAFLLDDTGTDKCRHAFEYLASNREWKLIANGSDRNGWAVFERVTASSE